MWWKQISDYLDFTNQKNLEELMDLGTDTLDPQITHHIKGDVICALGSVAKYEIMRGQWGQRTKRHQSTSTTTLV